MTFYIIFKRDDSHFIPITMKTAKAVLLALLEPRNRGAVVRLSTGEPITMQQLMDVAATETDS
jgi:hypothetical protein